METYTEFQAPSNTDRNKTETYRSGRSWNGYGASKPYTSEKCTVDVAKTVEIKNGNEWNWVPSVFHYYDEKGNPTATAFFKPRGEGLHICDVVDETLYANYLASK
jgi:hypothetical protein